MPKPKHSWSWPKFVRNFVVVVVVLTVLGVFYDNAIHPHLFAKNFGVVKEGQIYRSGKLTRMSLARVIERRHIRTVVDFGAHEPGSSDESHEHVTVTTLNADRILLRLSGDGTGDPNNYVSALRLMTDPDAQPILVHCAAGAQRTGCAVMLYRSIIEGVSPDEAFDEAQRYKHDPEKNPALRAYFMRWHDAIAESLRTGEPIPYNEP